MSKKNKKRYAYVIEMTKCIDCKSCMVGCKAENGVQVGRSRNWVSSAGLKGVFPTLSVSFEPGNCMHCENPPCEHVCPTKATYRRDDGIVLVDQNKCVGCKYCMTACPYGARSFNEEKKVTDKCTACVHRVDEGLPPACVLTCMAKARHFGDIGDPNSEVSQLLAQNRSKTLVLKKEKGTHPQIYYIV